MFLLCVCVCVCVHHTDIVFGWCAPNPVFPQSSVISSGRILPCRVIFRNV